MTETVYQAVFDGLADWEVGYATAHINNGQWHKEPGRYRVATVGTTTEPVTTMGGVRVVPDVTLEQIDPSSTAMLVLPGGDAWMTGANQPFVAKAVEVLDDGVPVAAICGATGALAAAGVLDDRPHTSNAVEFLQSVGYGGSEHYVDEPAVTDGDLITGSGTAPVEFAREVFARLDVYEPHILAAWYKLYGLNDPAGFYELNGMAAP
jgi:putative intracellular protease/amidase